MRRDARLILLLGLFAVGSAQAATAAGNGDLTPAHKAAVAEFAHTALAVDGPWDGYVRIWSSMPKANAGCTEPHARPKFAGFVRQTANEMIDYIKTDERGEVKLYAFSRDLRSANKRRYVAALDAVGKGFDALLSDARYGLKISHMIASGDCKDAPIAEATLAGDWKRDLKQTRLDLSKLALAWGV